MADSSSSSRDGLPESVRYRSGDVIDDKYRLIRPLGAGGTATVWVAYNQVLDVEIAIKLIRLESDSAVSVRERLLTEARTAARLGHPAIVRVFDFGLTSGGDPFVVMELLQGENLGDLIARESRLPAIRAVQLLLPIADGLASAHAKGIVHRDVKPENIVLARDESERLQPKLLDFGIARFWQAKSRITLAGAVLGTPDYMSPEQARGEDVVDHRTDVWSFCVVLYELLTGRTPFDAPNYNALLHSIIRDSPAPITKHAAGDEQLARILDRGLQKNPEERWETVRVLGEALALWLYEHGVREDVCAASLKTAWLDAGLAGVKIEVLADSPASASRNDERTPAAGLNPSEGQELVSTSDERPIPISKRRRAASAVVWLVLLLAAALFGLVAWHGFSARTDLPLAEPEATPTSVPPSPTAERPAPPARLDPRPRGPSALHSGIETPAALASSAPPVTRDPRGAPSPNIRARPTPGRPPPVVASDRKAAPRNETVQGQPPLKTPAEAAPSAHQREYDFGF